MGRTGVTQSEQDDTANHALEMQDHPQTAYHADAGQDDDAPAALVAISKQRWNQPRINAWRTAMACWGMLLMGANDGAYGALLPYIESYYNVSYQVVSTIFIAPAAGYLISAVIINSMHMRYRQRGVALVVPIIRLVAYLILSFAPPFPVVAIGFTIASLGNGLEDASWNAYVGNFASAHEVLGILHAAYGLGAALSPLAATAIITRLGRPWSTFSYIMVAASAFELLLAPVAFWKADGKAFRSEHQDGSGDKTNALTLVLRNRIVWICSVFLLLYVGTEVSLGGWTVTFMLRVRNASDFDAGISTTAFWLGITAGRIVLGFVTGHVGEKVSILIYVAFAIVFHLIFYFVPVLPVSFLAVSLEGFFLGPFFPAAVVAATKLLPPHLHVAGVGFAAAFGATGACVLPFAVGAIAQKKGVQVLMPIVLAFLVATGAVWACLPGRKHFKHE